jgi:hypothetical protein
MNNSKIKGLTLTFCIWMLMNSSYLFADHGCNSKEESFWRILIQDYHFGYTLFGNKPISFDRYYISPSIDMPACCKKNA